MAVSCVHVIFFNSQKSFSFLSNAPHIIKLKFSEMKNTARVPSRMRLTKNPVFLHYFSKFMGILLFLKYMYISLLLKMINGFSRPAKIMTSPFNNLSLKTPNYIKQLKKLFVDLLFEFLILHFVQVHVTCYGTLMNLKAFCISHVFYTAVF